MVAILIVEDDKTIADGIATFLNQHQFKTYVAYSLKSAEALIASNTVQIVLLDMMLPDGDGLSFAKTLSPMLKVLFLTAVDDEQTIVSSLAIGAEDYITKPFRLPILLARLKNIIQRYHLEQDIIVPFHHLVINEPAQIVLLNDKPIHFSANEQKLFFYLYANRNRIVTREQILTFMWDNKGEFVNDNTLTVTLKRLRQKIEQQTPIIETKRGIGYIMRDK